MAGRPPRPIRRRCRRAARTDPWTRSSRRPCPRAPRARETGSTMLRARRCQRPEPGSRDEDMAAPVQVAQLLAGDPAGQRDPVDPVDLESMHQTSPGWAIPHDLGTEDDAARHELTRAQQQVDDRVRSLCGAPCVGLRRSAAGHRDVGRPSGRRQRATSIHWAAPRLAFVGHDDGPGSAAMADTARGSAPIGSGQHTEGAVDGADPSMTQCRGHRGGQTRPRVVRARRRQRTDRAPMWTCATSEPAALQAATQPGTARIDGYAAGQAQVEAVDNDPCSSRGVVERSARCRSP